MSTPRIEFVSGVRAELPLLVGVFPFGMIYGVLALEAGLTAVQAQAMSLVVFGGSAQFLMAQLFAVQTPALIVATTAVLVNLRHALYSASIAPYVLHLRPRWQWLLAHLLTDEAYAVAITHYGEKGEIRHKHWFLLGSGLALWATWQLSTMVGIILGAQVPADWSLEFVLALTFIALLVPSLEDWPAVTAAFAAGFMAVLAFSLPYKSGLIVAATVGIASGMALESWMNRSSAAKRRQGLGE